jgi:hypothetical protein
VPRKVFSILSLKFLYIQAIILVVRMIIWATRMISPIILNHPRVRRMPGCIGISATLAWGQVVLFDFSSAGGTETTTCNIRSDPVAIWTDLFAKYIIYTYIYRDVYIYIDTNWLHTTRENVHVYIYIYIYIYKPFLALCEAKWTRSGVESSCLENVCLCMFRSPGSYRSPKPTE